MEDIVRQGLDSYLKASGTVDIKKYLYEAPVAPSQQTIELQEKQIVSEFIKKFISEKVNDQSYTQFVQSIAIPVIIMMLTVSRQDTPLMLKIIVTVLVVLHIVYITIQTFTHGNLFALTKQAMAG